VTFEFLQKSILSPIKRCLEGVKDFDKRGRGILRVRLNSTVTDKADPKPFQVHYHDGTVARYSEYWLHFILFALRTFNAETGENGVKYIPDQCELRSSPGIEEVGLGGSSFRRECTSESVRDIPSIHGPQRFHYKVAVSTKIFL
jgi:hypothetical protein